MYGVRVLVFALAAVAAWGQFRIPPEQAKRLDLALGEALSKRTLPCDAEATRPFLDFAFRFEIGYLVHCPLKDFGGMETPIATYMRVQTASGEPAWFSQWYRIPGLPNDLRSRLNLQRDHNDVEFSGVIAAGEGDYSIDLVVVDKQHRLFHRNWKTKVYPRGVETRAPARMQPNTVTALSFPSWERTTSDRNLSRLTVLVDAAPIHFDSTRLRAWDRAFLIEALSSVLTLLPSNSVHVVAFNLDQRREFFNTDDFGPEEAKHFSAALEDLELGKISYRVLQQSRTAAGMMLELLAREAEAKQRADGVILLGPANRLNDKVPSEWVADRRPGGPPIFYLKYSPITPSRFRLPLSSLMGMREDLSTDLANLEIGNNGEFPDVIQHVAALHDGVTINLHSPAELADALRKIDHRLHAGVQSSAATSSNGQQTRARGYPNNWNSARN
jgi:hypothetical protein